MRPIKYENWFGLIKRVEQLIGFDQHPPIQVCLADVLQFARNKILLVVGKNLTNPTVFYGFYCFLSGF